MDIDEEWRTDERYLSLGIMRQVYWAQENLPQTGHATAAAEPELCGKVAFASGEKMTTSEEIAQDEAVRLANKLKVYVPDSNKLEVVWERSESDEALRLVRVAGYSPNEFLDETELELNFNVSGFAKRFYQSYVYQVRTSLCNKDSDLRKTIGTAIGTGTGSLITALAVALSIPVGAAMLVAPIAAIILVKGIDAFCEMEDG